jgi:hypothetical protein
MVSNLPRELQLEVLKLVVNRDVRLELNISPGKIVIPDRLEEALESSFKVILTVPAHASVVKLGNPDDVLYWLIYYQNGEQRVSGRPYEESMCVGSMQGAIYKSIRGDRVWRTSGRLYSVS